MTNPLTPPPTKSLLTQDGARLAAAPLEHSDGRRLSRRPKAVPPALPAQQQPTSPAADDGRRPEAWLHIVAPPDWQATPTAHSWCVCGRDRFVVGRRKALALVEDHNAHRTTCPLLNRTEGRAAA